MSNKLCGIVWCHGNKDFGVWETDAISEEDQAKIEEILAKYDTTGTSVRSAWDMQISEIFCGEYRSNIGWITPSIFSKPTATDLKREGWTYKEGIGQICPKCNKSNESRI